MLLNGLKRVIAVILFIIGVFFALITVVGVVSGISANLNGDEAMNVGVLLSFVLAAALTGGLSVAFFKMSRKIKSTSRKLPVYELHRGNSIVAENGVKLNSETNQQEQQEAIQREINRQQYEKEIEELYREDEIRKQVEKLRREAEVQRRYEELRRKDEELAEEKRLAEEARRHAEWNVSRIDGMEGHEFEHFCADLLKKNGFMNVEVTRGSGDQGVDILADKDGIKYAIQCKNYATALSNKSIQEVSAGRMFYNCHVGVVMTNSTFTQGAINLAASTNVLLWDRDVLRQLMIQAYRN